MQGLKFSYDPKWQQVHFSPPTKPIISFQDVNVFITRPIHTDYLIFLQSLQNSIQSTPISATPLPPQFSMFLPYFHQLQQILQSTPPIQQPMRYGNRAFKQWHEKALHCTSAFLHRLIPTPISPAIDQLYTYVAESFGSNVRMDYGSGHEMSFMFFCWALVRLGFCREEHYAALVRHVFYKYINVMRKVQVQYMLEPAGSHGVWGLDDYHFLPFLLGAAELVNNDHLTPTSILDPLVVEQNAQQYMYINCVKFIMEAKKGVPFHQSAPYLHNITGAASWEKVSKGMIKMYKAEVLNKHPIVKHQYFGTIIPY